MRLQHYYGITKEAILIKIQMIGLFISVSYNSNSSKKKTTNFKNFEIVFYAIYIR